MLCCRTHPQTLLMVGQHSTQLYTAVTPSHFNPACNADAECFGYPISIQLWFWALFGATHHTAISIAIFPCGLYPSNSKSVDLKLSMSFTSGFRRSTGKGRGVLSNCCFKGSMWLL